MCVPACGLAGLAEAGARQPPPVGRAGPAPAALQPSTEPGQLLHEPGHPPSCSWLGPQTLRRRAPAATGDLRGWGALLA